MTNPTCVLHPTEYAGATCPRCGNFTCATCNPDGRTACPTCQQVTGEALRGKTPWERREELGLVAAFWQQVKLTSFEPTKFWATVDRNGSASDGFWFAWLVTTIAAIGSAPYNAFNFWLQAKQFEDISNQLGSAGGDLRGFFDIFSWFGNHPMLASVAITAWTIVVFPLGFFVNVGLIHLGCIIAGMRNHPITVTARAIAYAHAPNLALVVPVVGSFAAIYTLVLQVWGLREMQQGTTGRAIVAVLWFTIALMCFAMCAGMLAVTMIAGKVR